MEITSEIKERLAYRYPLDGKEDEYGEFCPSILVPVRCCGRKMNLKISSDLIITEFCKKCKRLNKVKI